MSDTKTNNENSQLDATDLMLNCFEHPGMRPPCSRHLFLFQCVAANPMHDDAVFAEEFRRAQEFANCHSAADLINEIALPEGIRHGGKIA